MRFSFLILISFLLLSCKGEVEKSLKEDINRSEKNQQAPGETNEEPLISFSSQEWGFSVEYSSPLEVYRGELPGNAPVINIFEASPNLSPPFAIHEPATVSYIAILPKGFGVDGPSGKRKSLASWDNQLELSFNLDQHESYAYLLENGEPWALSLRPKAAPESWNDYGSIFVHYSVHNFEAQCYSGRTGKLLPMEKCDPLGKDEVRISGEVSGSSKSKLNQVLESIELTETSKSSNALTNTIRLESPRPNSLISSPLQIWGEARGSWFFEGQAPFRLVDANEKMLAEGSMKVKGDWMTSNFVPFEASVSFEKPETKKGFLILKRANASGLPQHDQSLRLPVQFSEEN